MMLAAKPAAPSGTRNTRISHHPVNGGTFKGSQVIKIDVGTGGAQFLDTKQSYLKMTLKNLNSAAGETGVVQGSAYSLIQRLEIFAGSSLIETIDNYGVLCQMMLDVQAESGFAEGLGSITLGTGSSATNANVGNTMGITAATYDSRTFVLPLISGVIGSNIDKMLPLCFCENAPLRIEITLVSNADGLQAAGGTTNDWNVSDVEYSAAVTELSSDALSKVRADSNNANFEISCDSYRNYNFSVATGSQSISQLIPAKVSSAKGIFYTYRASAKLGAHAANAMDRCRPVPKTASIRAQFKVGASFVPPKPISSDPEAIIETLKALHGCGNVSSGGRINQDNYVKIHNEDNGLYMAGVELENFSHRSDVLETGISTMTSSVFLDSQFSAPTAATLDLAIFVHYDMILSFSGGNMTVKF
jgi:hypothetical protein